MNYPKNQNSEQGPILPDADLQAILGKNASLLNDWASKLGKYYASGKKESQLSSSQIRNILDTIQRMPGYQESELQLLRPKLAYVAGKEKKTSDRGQKIRHLQSILDKAIQQTNDKNFDMFVNFFEAIVAYHKFNGGE